jgi:hypothetical protein
VDEAEYEGGDRRRCAGRQHLRRETTTVAGRPCESDTGRPFIAVANVGLFASAKTPPLCPNVMVSRGVRLPSDLRRPSSRAYFVPVIGKVPDVVVEILSEESGAARRARVDRYAALGVPHCILFDPENLFEEGVLRHLRLIEGAYRTADSAWLEALSLGLQFWPGEFEMHRNVWLRWCDGEGHVIPTACERAERIKQLREVEEVCQQLAP